MARARAVQIVNLNRVAGDLAVIDPDADVTFGGWDFPSHSFNPEAEFVNAVEVTVRREANSPAGSVPLMLAKIFARNIRAWPNLCQDLGKAVANIQELQFTML